MYIYTYTHTHFVYPKFSPTLICKTTLINHNSRPRYIISLRLHITFKPEYIEQKINQHIRKNSKNLIYIVHYVIVCLRISLFIIFIFSFLFNFLYNCKTQTSRIARMRKTKIRRRVVIQKLIMN